METPYPPPYDPNRPGRPGGPCGWWHARERWRLDDEIVIPTGVHDAFTYLAHMLSGAIGTYTAVQTGRLADKTALANRTLLDQLDNISGMAAHIAKDLAIDDIRKGDLSRAEAARILHVHQNTVARWVADIEADESAHLANPKE